MTEEVSVAGAAVALLLVAIGIVRDVYARLKTCETRHDDCARELREHMNHHHSRGTTRRKARPRPTPKGNGATLER